MNWHDCKEERSTRSPNICFRRSLHTVATFDKFSFSRKLALATQDRTGDDEDPLLPPLLGLVPVLQEGVVVLAANMVSGICDGLLGCNVFGDQFVDQFYIGFDRWKRRFWSD